MRSIHLTRTIVRCSSCAPGSSSLRVQHSSTAATDKHSSRCRSQSQQALPSVLDEHPQQGSDTTKQYPRFYAPQLPTAPGMSVELEPEEAKHAVRVLRLQTGDTVELCDGRGGLVQCEVAATSKSSAMLLATAEPQFVPWQGPKWVVAAACLTLKGGRTDWLVEKATELGAHSLLPLITARSQTGTNKDKFKALAQKAAAGQQQQQQQQQQPQKNKRQRQSGEDGSSSSSNSFSDGSSDFFQESTRLGRLAVAATKQSLRTHGLQVQPAVSLDQLLPDLQAAPVSLVAMAGAPPVLQVLRTQWQQQGQPSSQQQQEALHEVQQQQGHPWDGQACYILIGPEGDFTPDEVSRLSAAGVLPVGLGPYRLRTETAAIAALSAAVLLSDWQGQGKQGVTGNS